MDNFRAHRLLSSVRGKATAILTAIRKPVDARLLMDSRAPPDGRTDVPHSSTLPNAPGVWARTDPQGRRRVHRVISQNGELYAKVGKLLPVAVPVRELPGIWDPVD